MPGFGAIGIFDVVPQHHVVAEVVLNRLEHLGAAVDHLARYVAEGIDDRFRFKIGIARPATKSTGLLVGEIEWSGQQY